MAKHKTEPASVARYITTEDAEAVGRMIRQRWASAAPAEKLPTTETLLERIQNVPEYSFGTFDANGEARAVLFLMGVSREAMSTSRTWSEICDDGTARSHIPHSRYLFGMSLTSVDFQASEQLFAFVRSELLRRGFREIFLGSPVSGLQKWMVQNPSESVDTYVHSKIELKGKQLPLDPLLQVYYRLGFREIVRVTPRYFPYESSLDYGVIIRTTNPAWFLAPLFRVFPRAILSRLHHVR